MGATFTYNQMGVDRLMAQQVMPAMARAGVRTVERARLNLAALGRNDSGRLSSSIVAMPPIIIGHRVIVTVYTPLFYAIMQELGTRDHGPAYARVMIFKPKGAATYVYSPWVRGVKPGLFLTRALRSFGPNSLR